MSQIKSQHISCPGGRAAGRGAKSLLAFQRQFLWRRSCGEEKDLRKEEREAKERKKEEQEDRVQGR